jgi:hypothetical protein
MQQEKNFGFLGFSFQQSLIRAVIEDKKFGETIIDFLDSKYFDNNSFRYIVEKFEASLLRYIKRIMYLSINDSEDILQEAFIKIYKNSLDILVNFVYDYLN